MPLSDDELDVLATKIVQKQSNLFMHMDVEKHYKSHEKLDRILDMYDAAQNVAWKTFLALLITGGVFVVAVGSGITKIFNRG